MRSIVLALLCAAMLSGQQSKLEQAWRLAANGQRGEAIQVLQSLIVTEPGNTDARLLLGSLLMEEGDKVASIEQLKTAVKQRPRSEEAQNALCPQFKTYSPEPAEAARYDRLFPLFRDAYFALGTPDAKPAALGHILPELQKIRRDATVAA